MIHDHPDAPDLYALLSEEDQLLAARYIGSLYRAPDLIIAPLGEAYLYRWHLVPRNRDANVYFHIQVLSDPERPLHDHPWDNQSTILSGGYDEFYYSISVLRSEQAAYPPHIRSLRKGDTVARRAQVAHRLVLPAQFAYTMTLFTTGPKFREWGFHTEHDGWIPQTKLIENRADGTSVYTGPAS